jgi:hypothetical protein
MKCPQCETSNRAKEIFCTHCSYRLQGFAPSVSRGPATRTGNAARISDNSFAEDKNWIIAVLLSLLPSAGQFYNGDYRKALVFLIGISICGYFGHYDPPKLIGVAIWIWAIVDAYRVARREAPLW